MSFPGYSGSGGSPGIFGANTIPVMMGVMAGFDFMKNLSAGKALVTAAKRNQQAAEYSAKQLEVNAGQAKASSQRDAYFQEEQGKLLMSAMKAKAGAGGTDAGVLNELSKIMDRARYNREASFYGGKDKARTLEMQANATRYQAARGVADAKAGERAYKVAALGSLAGGALKLSLHERYWAQDKIDGGGAGGGMGLMNNDPDDPYDFQFGEA